MAGKRKKAESVRATPAKSWKNGDTVLFTGSTHFANPLDVRGLPCKGGKAIITGIYPQGDHPYHLIRIPGSGATVYGWVDAEYVTEP